MARNGLPLNGCASENIDKAIAIKTESIHMSELNLFQKSIYQQALRLMPYVFWTLFAIVSTFMLVELNPKEDGLKYLDKIQHALIFFILSISGCLAFKKKILDC